VTDVREAEEADLAFVAVRRDQVDSAIADIANIRARVVVSLIDLPVGLSDLRKGVGTQRFVPGFPGVGGSIADNGVVEFIDVRQQPTTIQDGPVSPEVAAVLRSAGFRTAVVPDMAAWLRTHAVFVCAFESAIVAAGGDLSMLAADRIRVRAVVLEVRAGLRALARRGFRVTPVSLRLIFLRMPVGFATWYWMRQLAGPLGRLGFLPHSMASRDGELPALQRDVRQLTAPMAVR
jgi:2-dehydropantoate 2-reductase